MNIELTRTKRFATLGVTLAVAMALAAPAVLAAPPQHVLERARQAVAEGQEAAEGLADAATSGEEQKAKGLDQAAEAVEAAAARIAEREGKEFSGSGKALGRGHSDEVHAILAVDVGSPSDLAPHGETVSAFAEAFEKVKADHPGLGKGLDTERPEKGLDDGPEEADTDGD